MPPLEYYIDIGGHRIPLDWTIWDCLSITGLDGAFAEAGMEPTTSLWGSGHPSLSIDNHDVNIKLRVKPNKFKAAAQEVEKWLRPMQEVALLHFYTQSPAGEVRLDCVVSDVRVDRFAQNANIDINLVAKMPFFYKWATEIRYWSYVNNPGGGSNRAEITLEAGTGVPAPYELHLNLENADGLMNSLGIYVYQGTFGSEAWTREGDIYMSDRPEGKGKIELGWDTYLNGAVLDFYSDDLSKCKVGGYDFLDVIRTEDCENLDAFTYRPAYTGSGLHSLTAAQKLKIMIDGGTIGAGSTVRQQQRYVLPF